MKKNMKVIAGIAIGIIIGTSVVVGAVTIFRSEDITYSSPTNKTNVKDSLDELYNLTTNYEFYKPLATQVELGDYISMTPTSTSYIIPMRLTGHDSDQTINPSELNLWRVIKKNTDGTVEVISEYVSPEEIVLEGQTGYMNYIGVLNQIAAQYTNSKYVQSTRHVGDSGLENYCVSMEGCATAPCDDDGCHPSDVFLSDVEVMGDTGILIGRLKSGEAVGYYMNANTLGDGGGRKWYNHYLMTSQGKLDTSPSICSKGDELHCYDREGSNIRPILILKATNVIKSGNGKSAETAYTFE